VTRRLDTVPLRRTAQQPLTGNGCESTSATRVFFWRPVTTLGLGVGLTAATAEQIVDVVLPSGVAKTVQHRGLPVEVSVFI
jgi:hypothetical protein